MEDDMETVRIPKKVLSKYIENKNDSDSEQDDELVEKYSRSSILDFISKGNYNEGYKYLLLKESNIFIEVFL